MAIFLHYVLINIRKWRSLKLSVIRIVMQPYAVDNTALQIHNTNIGEKLYRPFSWLDQSNPSWKQEFMIVRYIAK